MAKFLENLLKDSTSSLFDILKIVFLLSGLFDSKMPLVNFLLDTRYVGSYILYKDAKKSIS